MNWAPHLIALLLVPTLLGLAGAYLGDTLLALAGVCLGLLGVFGFIGWNSRR